MPGCNTPEQNMIVSRARRLVSVYDDMAELIRLGAYRQGSDPQVDEAIHYHRAIEDFLSQSKLDATSLEDGYKRLADILGMNYVTPAAA
jgi:flagellum-specific ATP synthase